MNSTVADILRRHRLDPADFEPLDRRAPDVLTGWVAGRRAMAVWTALRSAYGGTGVWPVVRGHEFRPEEWTDVAPEATTSAFTFADLIDRALTRYVAEAAENGTPRGAQQGMSLLELARSHDKAISASEGASRQEGRGMKRAARRRQRKPEFQLLRKWPHEGWGYRKRVALALVPVGDPCDAVIKLTFGGYNRCPAGEELAVWLREWNKRYSAVPGCITESAIECIVDRPAQAPEVAMALAAEMWLLCEDIVDQGTGTVERLAEEVLGSRLWWLWWD